MGAAPPGGARDSPSDRRCSSAASSTFTILPQRREWSSATRTRCCSSSADTIQLKRMLDVSSGFVDCDESAGQAALRATLAKTGIALDAVLYLASFNNRYEYRGVLHRICDLYYEAWVEDRPETIASDDAAAIVWRQPEDLTSDQLAFDTLRNLPRLLSRPGAHRRQPEINRLQG